MTTLNDFPTSSRKEGATAAFLLYFKQDVPIRLFFVFPSPSTSPIHRYGFSF
jgi:hypothetical protein